MAEADRRTIAAGTPLEVLMERAGQAVAWEVRQRLGTAYGKRVVVTCGKGNNGGDGLVAARRLAEGGTEVVVALVSTAARPSTTDAARNWDRLNDLHRVTRVQTPVARDTAMLAADVGRASVVVDALLGTGVRGALREPIRGAVDLVARARALGIPIVAVDTPTAVDLSSGDPSDPVVQADLTVTFHRPKTGLLTRRGAALAGRVLVAPIGIPLEADRG
jgi:NAD(P)H-hydrate epimerase